MDDEEARCKELCALLAAECSPPPVTAAELQVKVIVLAGWRLARLLLGADELLSAAVACALCAPLRGRCADTPHARN